ncbi:hypothetical protein FJTKL_09818 [Diaporthe vaccinii]|uniref:Uncharacterized protein n=1 Tax=Diaporthe vaccinii TaxID=105482 RepID=A0ABR4EM04_9PEZI
MKSDQSQLSINPSLRRHQDPIEAYSLTLLLTTAKENCIPSFSIHTTTRRTSGDRLLSPIPPSPATKDEKKSTVVVSSLNPVLPALELPRQTGDQPLLEATTVHHQRTIATAHVSPRTHKRTPAADAFIFESLPRLRSLPNITRSASNHWPA